MLLTKRSLPLAFKLIMLPLLVVTQITAQTQKLRLILLCGLLVVPCLAFAGGPEKIRVGNVTLQTGMPQEKALRSLRSHGLSVIEDHADAYLIKEATNGEILGRVEFKESKLVSASKNWGRPLSDQLASAPFANAVFEALSDVTGPARSSCMVVTSDTDPPPLLFTNSGATTTTPAPGSCGTGCRNNHAYITCGKKTATINDVVLNSHFNAADFPDVTNNNVSVSVNYRGEPLLNGDVNYSLEPLFSRNKTMDGYQGPILVGNITLFLGMPEEQALHLLTSSPVFHSRSFP
jgi:hypothetical protein